LIGRAEENIRVEHQHGQLFFICSRRSFGKIIHEFILGSLRRSDRLLRLFTGHPQWPIGVGFVGT